MKNIRDIYFNLDKFSTKWDPYLDAYEKHFSRFVDKEPIMLEIGIADGGSIEMWLKYFGKSKIYGVDADPNWLNHKYSQEGNVELSYGDQADPVFWDMYLKDKPLFDIVLDDGGHEMNQQIITLLKVFPHVRDGGVFMIEDTHTSYWKEWGGNFRDPNTCVEFCKGLVDILNVQHIRDRTPPTELINIFSSINSITFYNSMIVFEKGFVKPFTVINSRQK